MHALFLVAFGTFSSNASGNCILGSLHQQPSLEASAETLPQWLLLLHSGQTAGSTLFESSC